MRGKHRYGCAPIWRFCTVSSRRICPSNGRLSFRPKPLPSVLTHIYYKKVETISQRSPVKWRVVVQPSQEYSVAPSDRFIPLAPSRRPRATMHQNEGIQSIQVPRRKPRINTFNMFDLDSMKSLLHCWFEVSVQQRDNRRGVSSGRANGTNKKPTFQYRTHLME
jgi:hypothetical protein